MSNAFISPNTILALTKMLQNAKYRKGTSIRQAPFFGTSEHYGKAHGSLLSG